MGWDRLGGYNRKRGLLWMAGMQLNIKEMIGGGPARLRWVYRYSTSRVRHPESVAEHSWYVCFYALMVGRWCDNNRCEVELGLLLPRAILHDLEECGTGDFPRILKHSSPEVHEMLEAVGRGVMKGLAEKLLPLPDDLERNILFHTWANAKGSDVEGRIVEFADFLAVLGFLLQEGQGEGNGSIGVHVADMSTYFGKFQRREYEFLGPLTEQCGQIMQELGIYDSGRVGKGKLQQPDAE